MRMFMFLPWVTALQAQFSHKCNPSNSLAASLTRDVYPNTHIHSHNDYWRSPPLFAALSRGIASVESDIWLFDETEYTDILETEFGTVNVTADQILGSDAKHKLSRLTLYVGHNELYLNASNTLETLYLDPIYNMLSEINCGGNTNYGLFYDDHDVSLQWLIDVKTNHTSTYHVLLCKLDKLRAKGWLTTPSAAGPVTVVLTGNQSPEVYQPNPQRMVYADCEMTNLPNDVSVCGLASSYLGRALSVYPRANKILNDTELATLTELVSQCHQVGLKTRIWGAPSWPKSVRLGIWQQELESGVDYLNVDNLQEAIDF